MTQPRRDPGYRGALPPRADRLARPWVITVIALTVLVFVLALAGVPSRFVPAQSASPVPSAPLPSSSSSASVRPSPSL